MYVRQVGAGIAIAGITFGAVLGATGVAQAKVPAGTYALRNGYYNDTPASTGLHESCDFYTTEANKYLANGNPQSAAQFVTEVNSAKGCTIVYHSYSLVQATQY